jgi:hypothetical protein
VPHERDATLIDIVANQHIIEKTPYVAADRRLRRCTLRATVATELGQEHRPPAFGESHRLVIPVIDQLRVAVQKHEQWRGRDTVDTLRRQEPRFDAWLSFRADPDLLHRRGDRLHHPRPGDRSREDHAPLQKEQQHEPDEPDDHDRQQHALQSSTPPVVARCLACGCGIDGVLGHSERMIALLLPPTTWTRRRRPHKADTSTRRGARFDA